MFRVPTIKEIKERNNNVERDKEKTPVIPTNEFMTPEELEAMLNVRILE